jgi:hypothetical protein
VFKLAGKNTMAARELNAKSEEFVPLSKLADANEKLDKRLTKIEETLAKIEKQIQLIISKQEKVEPPTNFEERFAFDKFDMTTPDGRWNLWSGLTMPIDLD